MKGTTGAFLRRPALIATLVLSMLMASISHAGASSVTTTTLTRAQSCGVVVSPSVRIISTGSICVISLHVGGNARVTMRSGFRWGDPRSNSKAVKVTKITRGTIGVDGVTLHAVSVGHATIRTTGTVYCRSGVACPDLALLWSLRVIVTA